jgi:hypothetical protein
VKFYRWSALNNSYYGSNILILHQSGFILLLRKHAFLHRAAAIKVLEFVEDVHCGSIVRGSKSMRRGRAEASGDRAESPTCRFDAFTRSASMHALIVLQRPFGVCAASPNGGDGRLRIAKMMRNAAVEEADGLRQDHAVQFGIINAPPDPRS